MTISQCLFFTYDGINSQDYGIINCTIDQGLYTEPFISSRSIIETAIRGRDKKYFQRTVPEHLQFSLTFAFQDNFDRDKLREVSRWLNQPFFVPLIFYDSPTMSGEETVYYALYVDSPNIVHTGYGTGYITINFHTSAPHGYSPVYKTPSTTIYEYFLSPWQPMPMPTNVEFENAGDISIKPIFIIRTFIPRFTIINLNNSGQKLKFDDLSPNEVLTIDAENEIITSSVSGVYRYNNMSQDSTFISMVVGVNTIQMVGNFEFQIKYEMKYLV